MTTRKRQHEVQRRRQQEQALVRPISTRPQRSRTPPPRGVADLTPHLRVGYVNSQGLNEENWRQFSRWVERDIFDVVWIAETWYVGWPGYGRGKMTVAATTRPTERTGSRPKGGMCVLASALTASRIEAVVGVEETAITLRIDGWQISGVYLPPSLSPEQVSTVLMGLAASDVVFGDFNIHFSPRRQQATPKARAEAIVQWQQQTGQVRQHPRTDACPIRTRRLWTTLTTDHVWSRGVVRPLLHLIDNQSLGLDTDHLYTLHIHIPTTIPIAKSTPTHFRFWTYRLSDPMTKRRLRDAWRCLPCQSGLALDVNDLHHSLIHDCQTIATQVLGRVPLLSRQPKMATTTPSKTIATDPSATATIRLMRQAMAADRDNEPLLPTAPGGDAIQEAADVLRQRFTAESSFPLPTLENSPSEPDPPNPFTLQAVRMEVRRQLGAKACAADGVHIRLVKALADTTFLDRLTHLYTTCWDTGRTPTAWNVADICFVIKDSKKPKTIANVRPITLICIFRKVFEAILLSTFNDRGWAAVHPTQAGFRRTYSTLTHAAVMHLLLRERLIDAVVFLDFRAAFDVVPHALLLQMLRRRRCPTAIQTLLTSLNCLGLSSRIIANSQTSPPFPRTRGVLQGSPISPCLFNLFVDDLLRQLNHHADPMIPQALFYADDGTLLARPGQDLQPWVDLVFRWACDNGMELNVAKCGYLTTRLDATPLRLGLDEIPHVDTYRYLGFPVTTTGIDWEAYLTTRIDAAQSHAAFLTLASDSWGIAHRLRVYRQYLAPMFEYGGPLIYAWLQSDPEAKKKWPRVTRRWKDLIGWIVGGHGRHRMTANLLGLTQLPDRYLHLHTAFQWQLDHASHDNPLCRLLGRKPFTPFGYALQNSKPYGIWRAGRPLSECTRSSLDRFLTDEDGKTIERQSKATHLTAIVPFSTRQVKGLRYADISLTAALSEQHLLFQYRRGVFGHGLRHCCALVDRSFLRGDEECPCFGTLTHLSAPQQRVKRQLVRHLGKDGRFTVVDYWLAVKDLNHAVRILQAVDQALRQRYSSTCFDASTVL